MIAAVQTADGVYRVDLDEQIVLGLEAGETIEPADPVRTPLPRVVAAARSGSTVVAVV